MNKHHKSRASRTFSPIIPRLSESECVNLMLAPRLHLEMLLNATVITPYDLLSVVGVFNVATALAYLNKDKRAITLYESVQQSVLAIAQHGEDSPELRDHLRRVFNVADVYIVQQSRQNVLRAINLVEYQIKSGEGTTLMPVAMP